VTAQDVLRRIVAAVESAGILDRGHVERRVGQLGLQVEWNAERRSAGETA